MKSTVILALFVSAVSCLTSTEYKQAFAGWLIENDRVYTSEEFQLRYAAFSANLDFVSNWDSAVEGFEVELNKFADLTLEEYRSTLLGFRPVVREQSNVFEDFSEVALPDSVDWRTVGAVTAVKDQGQCGSCWSFSATGSIEAQWFLTNHTLTSLSEQNLMDCSIPQGNEGCNGGLMDAAFDYVIANKGIDTEASYPYTGKDGKKCLFSISSIGSKISSYKDIPTKNESALTNMIATTGPVSVAIDASHNSFQLYSKGVYKEKACSATNLDHGVLAVGYGTDATGGDYYIVKNSWGASWGLSGYIWMSRGNANNCGIATMASIPFV